MLRDADTAMYRAKVGSGGGYVVFEPSMYTAALERIDFEGALHGAVARGEMHLDYQPIFDHAQGRVAGFEALIRWNHPALQRRPRLVTLPPPAAAGSSTPRAG